MGHGSKGAIKDRSNSASPGIDIQGGDTVSAIIWQRDLGGDRVDDQGPGGITPSGGTTNHWDDI